MEKFGESSQLRRERLDNWMPQLTTDVLFCADKTGLCHGSTGGPDIKRFMFQYTNTRLAVDRVKPRLYMYIQYYQLKFV